MFCRYCGKEISDDAKFCEFCGAKNAKTEKEKTSDSTEESEYRKIRTVKTATQQEPTSGIPSSTSSGWVHAGYGANSAPGCGKDFRQVTFPYSPNQPQSNYPQSPQGHGTSDVHESPHKKKKFLPVFLTIICIMAAIFIIGKIADYVDNNDYNTIGNPEIEITDENYFSTTDRPELSDFSWYEDIKYSGIWSDAEPVKRFDEMNGSWKAVIIDNPDLPSSEYLLNIDISGTAIDTVMTMDWYKALYNGEPPVDESQNEDTVLYGGYEKDSGVICFDFGSIKVKFDNFYFYNDAQYGIGHMKDKNNAEYLVLFVRP